MAKVWKKVEIKRETCYGAETFGNLLRCPKQFNLFKKYISTSKIVVIAHIHVIQL